MQGWKYDKGLIYLRPIFWLIKLAFFRARAKKEPVSFIYAFSGPLIQSFLLLEAYFATFSSTISNQSLPKNAKNVIPKNQGLRDRTRGGARGALPFLALFVRNHKYRKSLHIHDYNKLQKSIASSPKRICQSPFP